jgi:hypothetical protein
VFFPSRARWEPVTARKGRVEAGLERSLAECPEIGPAERGALRSQARAVDVAEAMGDAHLVTEANRVYLELRVSAGLTAANQPEDDSFARLLAEMGKPTAGLRDASKP